MTSSCKRYSLDRVQGLHPRSFARPSSSRAELGFWQALKEQLPTGWSAWHSLRLRTRSGQEGEGDFVLWVPDVGIIVIEIKGGKIHCEDGLWSQNGYRMRSPLEQSRGWMGKLIDVLDSDFAEVSAQIEPIVCFPETAFSVSPDEPYLRDRVLGEQDMPRLGERLKELVSQLFAEETRPITGDVASALHALWGESFVPQLNLGAQIRRREDELLQLDVKQQLYLDFAEQNTHTLVYGGAGTGKTLIARERCRRLAELGRKSLYLCSTASLARRLRSSCSFEIDTVRDYARYLLERFQPQLLPEGDKSTWAADAWSSLVSAAAGIDWSKEGMLFDDLVIDEAQDLSDGDWQFISAILQDQSIWVFADPNQSFWTDRHLPMDWFESKMRLPDSYRCPAALLKLANQYTASYLPDGAEGIAEMPVKAISDADKDELGRYLSVLKIPSVAALETSLGVVLQSLLEQGSQPSDIAILSLAGQARSQVAHLDQLGESPLCRGDNIEAHDFVIADTFLRFKGLERPIIIVTELHLGHDRYSVRLHTALTRAMVNVIIIATEEDLQFDHLLRTVLG